jgi:hypothetical protein
LDKGHLIFGVEPFGLELAQGEALRAKLERLFGDFWGAPGESGSDEGETKKEAKAHRGAPERGKLKGRLVIREIAHPFILIEFNDDG